MKTLPSQVDSDTSKNQTSTPTLLVSSNFELVPPFLFSKFSLAFYVFSYYNSFSLYSQLQPRRGKSPVSGHPAFSSVAYRSDAVVLLLRKAFKEKQLGIVCRKVGFGINTHCFPPSVIPYLLSCLPLICCLLVLGSNSST